MTSATGEQPPRWSGQSRLYRMARRFFGPAQLSRHDLATPVTDVERDRERRLQSTLERVERPDGSSYVVRREVTNDADTGPTGSTCP
ncbi:hypothetical protein FH969_04385 [Miniimonas arenae]|uniref:Uncharacterized protein n=1 Tax=Miniimonas arenae TaxID=676201 RepID=A0A5C5BFR4_9MICO|nr:hypothetical protein [Miniimonas arenae]TNU76178.1 hypothetical protein FH969_04385 [Miniimonas arenae]